MSKFLTLLLILSFSLGHLYGADNLTPELQAILDKINAFMPIKEENLFIKTDNVIVKDPQDMFFQTKVKDVFIKTQDDKKQAARISQVKIDNTDYVVMNLRGFADKEIEALHKRLNAKLHQAGQEGKKIKFNPDAYKLYFDFIRKTDQEISKYPNDFFNTEEITDAYETLNLPKNLLIEDLKDNQETVRKLNQELGSELGPCLEKSRKKIMDYFPDLQDSKAVLAHLLEKGRDEFFHTKSIFDVETKKVTSSIDSKFLVILKNQCGEKTGTKVNEWMGAYDSQKEILSKLKNFEELKKDNRIEQAYDIAKAFDKTNTPFFNREVILKIIRNKKLEKLRVIEEEIIKILDAPKDEGQNSTNRNLLKEVEATSGSQNPTKQNAVEK